MILTKFVRISLENTLLMKRENFSTLVISLRDIRDRKRKKQG